jgi:dipeptidyl aminopeptidase/acylaminoacyl peptidase
MGGVSNRLCGKSALIKTTLTFLVCADDDRSHVTATAELYLGLEKQGVSSEMHIYARGGHGFGITDVHAPFSTWDQRLLEWMFDRKILVNR